MVSRVIRLISLGLLVTPLLFCSAPALAQSSPDLPDLIAGWAGGSLRSPVSCDIDGKLTRGVRRVILEPVRSPGRSTELRVKFIDLHVDGATRCVDSRGQAVPNVVGTVLARHPGRPHPETAQRDFRNALKRKKGFELEVVDSRVKIRPLDGASSAAEEVDFRRGKLDLSLIYPATDPARELAPFKSQRKFLLTLKAPSGEVLSLPLFDPKAP